MADEQVAAPVMPQSESTTPEPEVVDAEGLKAALVERDGRVQALEKESAGLREELALALERYRASLVKSVPEAPEEMVRGATVRELEDSYSRARAMVERVRSQLEAKQSRERVPAGAPPRTAPDLSGLSPREKIAQGLAKR